MGALSDNAGQCGKAQRILALQPPYIVWMLCWAYQVNLMVGHLMSQSVFAAVCNAAVKIATIIRALSLKWYTWLINKVERAYGKGVICTLYTLGATQWNTLQAVFASQLRIRTACEALVNYYKRSEGTNKLPDCLLEWGKPSFWKMLEEAELLIRPLVDASFLMQRDTNTLADVLVMLINIYKGTSVS